MGTKSTKAVDVSGTRSPFKIQGRPPEPFPFVATGTIDLARVWGDIRGGRLEVIGAASFGEVHYLSLRRCVPKRTYSEPSLQELELALTRGTKAASIAMNLALSTLALRLAVTLRDLGASDKRSRLPLILGLAVAAHHKHLRLSADVQKQPRGIVVRHSIYPDLKNLLSPSEFAIAMALLSGGTHAEIARARGVSLRTVANQVVAVFRRLGVSSRTDLIQWLAVQGAAQTTVTVTGPSEADRSGAIDVLRAEIGALSKRVAKLERKLARASAGIDEAGAGADE